MNESTNEAPKIERNPILTTSLSFIPGGGQFYSKKYISGGLFLTTEAILGITMKNRYKRYLETIEPYQEAHDSLAVIRYKFNTFDKPDSTEKPNLVEELTENSTHQDTLIYNEYKTKLDLYDVYINQSTFYDSLLLDTIKQFETYSDKMYNNLSYDVSYNNYLSWAINIYLWNIIDGYALSNQFTGWNNPEPARAGWLSAIPFTGAGQVYNGELFKAGLVSTIQLQSVLSAFRYNKLLKLSQDQYNYSVANSGVLGNNKALWEDRHKRIKSVQTRFLWYAVVFYIYGVADAYIDAELNDFDSNFKIYPQFDAKTEAVGAKVEIDF